MLNDNYLDLRMVNCKRQEILKNKKLISYPELTR